MEVPSLPYPWPRTPQEALALQQELSERVRIGPPQRGRQLQQMPRLVAGVDAAYSAIGECFAAAVVWELSSRRMVGSATARLRVAFPYVPGLLAWRELPALIEALRKLERTPQALICDGHGLAHPRRFGLACQLGVLLELPCIGCAKSRLVGDYEQPGAAPGSRAPLFDRGERVGTVLRSRLGSRPVFVSVGHRLDLSCAERIVQACLAGYRLPEPLRLAHNLAVEARSD